MDHQPQYYHDYLQLDKILDAQAPVSFGEQQHRAHDEMLFIVTHQAYELWFRQMLFEAEAIIATMTQPSINDNRPDLQVVVHRLRRMTTIMDVLVHQMDIMETMTPMDFLDFRDLLRPASGFQSWQFKVLEARLGLPFAQRHGQEHYLSALRPEHRQLVQDAEKLPALLPLINSWLERMPFFDDESLWSGDTGEQPAIPSFWHDYRRLYERGLLAAEQSNLKVFDQWLGFDNDCIHHAALSCKACRAALFIMLYPGYPLLQQPWQLINGLMELDEKLSTWRYRHLHMVQRMIGNRVGTGGSSGKGYLQGAALSHGIFSGLSTLTSFLIARHHLPTIPAAIEQQLGFAS